MILTRPFIPADRDFVVSGWSSSYRASRDCTTPMTLYATQKHAEVEFYLERARVLVAHGDLGVLMGFIAYDPAVYTHARKTFYGYVLYVYVSGPFRERGVARRLFAAADIDPLQHFGYLCRTWATMELRSKIPLAEHEPYRARYEEIEHVRATEAAGAAEEQPHSRQEDLSP